MERIDRYASWLKSQGIVTRTSGVPDFLKQINLAFLGSDSDGYRLPQDDDLIAQFVLLLEGPDRDIGQFLTPDHSATRLSANVELGSGRDFHRVVERAQTYLRSSFGDVDAYLTGVTDLNYRNGQNIVAVQVRSFVVALPLIVLVVALLLRSLRLVPLIAVANVIPVGACLGLMGLLDIELNPCTALVASTALGLVIDDSVYLLAEVVSEARNPRRSLLDVFTLSLERVGPALFKTSLVVCVCFGVLGWAQFRPNSQLGLLTSACLTVALIVDVVVLPAMVTSAPSLVGRSTRSAPQVGDPVRSST